jgi:hypothetical protein
LPAASRASTVITLTPPWSVIEAIVQLVVPVAVPLPPLSFIHVTCVTPTTSVALPLTVNVLVLVVYVVAVVGAVICTSGGVVSGPASPTVQVNDFESDNNPSEAVATTLYEPTFVGAPLISPVLAPRRRPAGRPVAL